MKISENITYGNLFNWQMFASLVSHCCYCSTLFKAWGFKFLFWGIYFLITSFLRCKVTWIDFNICIFVCLLSLMWLSHSLTVKKNDITTVMFLTMCLLINEQHFFSGGLLIPPPGVETESLKVHCKVQRHGLQHKISQRMLITTLTCHGFVCMHTMIWPAACWFMAAGSSGQLFCL